ncbi:LysR family transcriptional regulator [Marinomonas sp. PE14-40]|uniref:LysR family transcriptional regulator n=1 Tax=Marinomonas sp. PE14-40 TaxID=3060621 RepID=UPI003F6666F6
MDTNKVISLLTEMAVFVAVVEQESFSKAGEKLNLAPSSISRSIAKLEAAFGTKLLERTTRKVKLNPKGAQVFEQCQSMLASAKLAANAAQSLAGEVSGVLRVAAPKAFAKQVISPIVLDFAEAYPKVTVKLMAVDHFIDPISEEVDVIIHFTHHPIEGLVAKHLSTTKLIVCASPDYLAKNGIPKTPDDLKLHDCITLGEVAGDDIWRFQKAGEKVKVQVPESFSVNHTQVRRDVALRGLGIATFPDFAIQETIEKGALIPVLTDWQVLERYQGDIVAQYAQSKFVPVQIRTFIEFLHARF